MQRIKPQLIYQLQVVKEGEDPKWSGSESDLVIGSQELGSGYVQYWAYQKDSEKQSDDVPPAEELAVRNNSATPAIIIDQHSDEDEIISLILAKDGHAWAKSETSIDNLEENINSMVEMANQDYDFSVEHFMTTGHVSPLIEKKLDHMEDNPDDKSDPEAQEAISESASYEAEQIPANPREIKAGGSIGLGGGSSSQIRMGNDQFPSSGVYVSSDKSSKLWTIILGLVLIGLIAGVFYFREKIFTKLGVSIPGITTDKPQPTITMTPTPTIALSPAPTPVTLDRSKYQIRVLNGTSTSGAASTLGDQLKELGWKVPNVGNAESSDTPQTTVRVKKDLTDVAKVLVDDLAKYYQATSSADLEKTSKFDAEVIIGKK